MEWMLTQLAIQPPASVTSCSAEDEILGTSFPDSLVAKILNLADWKHLLNFREQKWSSDHLSAPSVCSQGSQVSGGMRMVSLETCSSFLGAERPLRWWKLPDSSFLNPSDVRTLLNWNMWWVTSVVLQELPGSLAWSLLLQFFPWQSRYLNPYSTFLSA